MSARLTLPATVAAALDDAAAEYRQVGDENVRRGFPNAAAIDFANEHSIRDFIAQHDVEVIDLPDDFIVIDADLIGATSW
jgi:hypothetical protein